MEIKTEQKRMHFPDSFEARVLEANAIWQSYAGA
jgi:hypothetical protein